MTKEELKTKLLAIIQTWDEYTSIASCKTDVKDLIEYEEKFDFKDKTLEMTPYELGKYDSEIRNYQIGESRYNNPFLKNTGEWFDYIKGFKGKK